MTWGVDLWDQFDLVCAHSQQGIEFLDKTFARFLKDRARIESDYAKELRKLTKGFLSKKKEAEEENVFSYQKAFHGIVKETDDLAGQHEVIAENLVSNVYKELVNLHNDLKNEKKKQENEAKKIQQALKSALSELEMSKKAYDKASSEATQALNEYHKADKDMTLTKLQVEKCKTASIERGQAAEKAKEEYRDTLDKANRTQTLHYSSDMPAIFDQLQQMEEKRINRVGELLCQYSEEQKKVQPIISKCLDCMTDHAKKIDSKQDTQIVIDQKKSGLSPPGEIPFEEAGKPAAKPSTPIGKSVKPSKKTKPKKFFWKQSKGDYNGAGNDFQQMAPAEKTRHCQKKVNELKQQVQQMITSRNGMEKMLTVYQGNPALGDVASVQEQLNQNSKELDKVNEELYTYECYLAALLNKDAPPAPEKYEKTIRPPPAPVDEIQASPSGQQNAPTPATPEDDWSEDDIDFEEIKCRVLYDFSSGNDGELDVQAGEELIVLEPDTEDSGWTKAMNGKLEGFVPTAYIEIIE